ncbi:MULTISPECIES: hypothetical protein [unclassified Empedobacter]|uniref:hypothetical protein n=1 Tax=unclassified Empedobacter TaxID=2643773 RepID=UPI0025BE55C4|nr:MULTISPECIES: hypothetical protein [unclassified Empedobacter]
MKYKDKYDLIFLTTHQNNNYIFELLNSINIIEDFNLFVLILSQDVKLEISEYKFDIEVVEIGKMSLSKARNIGLKFLSKNNINSRYIMFPDDDSTFDISFFENFNNVTESGDNFIIPIYCKNSDKKLYLGKKLKEGELLNYKNHYMIGSPNQIINYERNVISINFDEKLGVGAVYGSCEDFDLFIRLNNKGEKFYYSSILYNYHPEKMNSFRNLDSNSIYNRITSYSLGFIYILEKYKLFSLLPYFFIRPILASFFYLLKLNFKLFWVYFRLLFFRVLNTFKFLIK